MYKSDEWPSYFLICEYNVGRKVTGHEKFRNYLFKFKSTMNYLANSIYRYPFMQKMTMAFSTKNKQKTLAKTRHNQTQRPTCDSPKKLGLRDDANFGGSRFLFRQ